jgi:hypothetical protein
MERKMTNSVQPLSGSYPKPNGKYPVGCTLTSFRDEKRMDKVSGKSRHLPVMIWYPAVNVSGKDTLRIRDVQAFRKAQYYIPSTKLEKLATNSYVDAEIAKDSKFPVLIFSQGYNTNIDSYTAYMEELASQGYIIFAIGHTNYATVARFPDGSVVLFDKNGHKKAAAEFMRIAKKYNAAQKQLSDINIGDDIIKAQTIDLMDAFDYYHTIIYEMSDDIKFIANIIEDIASGKLKLPFVDSLDLSKGLGVFGHSMGGASAMKSVQTDNRFSCCIDIDGPEYGKIYQSRLEVPTLFLMSKTYYWLCRLTFNQCKHDAYYAYFKDTFHLDFCDCVFYPTFMGKMMKMLSSMDPFRLNKIATEYMVSFLDKYLKGKPASMLEEDIYPEVITKRKKASS